MSSARPVGSGPATSPLSSTASTPARSSSSTCSTRRHPALGDDQLADGNVRQQLERALEVGLAFLGVALGDDEDLRVDPLERLLQLLLVANVERAVEAEVACGGDELLEQVVLVGEILEDEDAGIGAGAAYRVERVEVGDHLTHEQRQVCYLAQHANVAERVDRDRLGARLGGRGLLARAGRLAASGSRRSRRPRRWPR